MRTFLVAAAVLAASVGSTAANAQLVQNGGFENPVITDSCCNTAPPAANLPDWTVTPDVNVVNGTFMSTNAVHPNLAFEGNQYLDLVGQSGNGSISQILATAAGVDYNLSFEYSHNLFAGLTSASAQVFINGVLAGTVTHTGGSTSDLAWQLFHTSFIATGPTTLSFVNTAGAQNEGVFLDAVTVAAVPEPATWAMMLMGFGAIGISLRRRPPNLRLSQLA